MTHEEIQDLLEEYVDDRLDRATRREVDRHLESCAECRAILDGVAPVDLGKLGGPAFDEQSLRRMSRRSVLRTAWSVIVLVVAGLLVMTIFSALVYQPLLINRGGRAADAARATIDVTSMINAGALVTDGEIQSGLWHREIEIFPILPVGSSQRPLDPVEVRLGALALSGPDGVAPWPYLMSMDDFGDAEERLLHLGSGTVATVQVEFFDDAISVDEAQAIADDTSYDTRVTWAGFALLDSSNEPMPIATAGYLGYGTCIGQQPFDADLLGASSAGFGQSVTGYPASIDDALHSVIAGLENLENHPEWISNLTFQEGDSADASAALDVLESSPEVRTLVITGPSDEISRQLEDLLDPNISARVLAVDFYNWAPGMCGR